MRLNSNSMVNSNQVSSANFFEDSKKKARKPQAAIAKQSNATVKKRIKKNNQLMTQPDYKAGKHTVENQDTWNPRCVSALT